MSANDEIIEACPTDVAHAPAERVWERLVDPDRLDWVARVVEAPAGPLRAGDRVRFAASLGLRLTWDVLAVEPARRLALDITLPFGIANHMTIALAPIDAERCRITFH